MAIFSSYIIELTLVVVALSNQAPYENGVCFFDSTFQLSNGILFADI